MAVIDSGTMHHVCFLVKDVEEAARGLSESLSISWSLWTIDVPEATIHGRPETFSFRVALGGIGGLTYELIEPLGTNSVYTEHLESKGEGFHHTCLAFADYESVQAASAELAGKGLQMIQGGQAEGAFAFYYFDIPETNSALELLWLGELPPPEMTIG